MFFLDVAITFFKSFRQGAWWHKTSKLIQTIVNLWDTNPILSMKFLNRSGSWNTNLEVWNSCTRLFPCVWGWPSNHLNHIEETLLTPCDELNNFKKYSGGAERQTLSKESRWDWHHLGRAESAHCRETKFHQNSGAGDNLGYSAAQALEPLYKRTLDGIWFTNGGNVERDTQ